MPTAFATLSELIGYDDVDHMAADFTMRVPISTPIGHEQVRALMVRDIRGILEGAAEHLGLSFDGTATVWAEGDPDTDVEQLRREVFRSASRHDLEDLARRHAAKLGVHAYGPQGFAPSTPLWQEHL